MLKRLKCFFGFHKWTERKVRAFCYAFPGYHVIHICENCLKTITVFQTDEIIIEEEVE